MTNLQKLKSDFKKGLIKKADYIKEMYGNHKHLFDYCTFMGKTDISKIEITNKGVTMTIRNTGIKMLCPRDDYRIAPIEILNFDHYEMEEMEMILKLTKEDFTVFDIGANIGWYTLNMSKLIKGVKVFAFEPVPQTFEFLKKNIKLNNLESVSAFNLGLSDKSGKFILYFYPEGTGNASFQNLSDSKKAEKIICKVTTLDDFVQEQKMKVDFIKCDVEGAELLVYKGGMKTINKFKPVVLTEMLRKWAAKFKYHPNDIIKLLGKIGYQCFTAEKGKLKSFEEITQDTIETNFFFLHKVKHNNLINTLI